MCVITAKVVRVSFVTLFIVLMVFGSFHVVFAEKNLGQEIVDSRRSEEMDQQLNDSTADALELVDIPDIIMIPEDLLEILPNISLDFSNDSDLLVQLPKRNVTVEQEAAVVDVGFYNMHRRVWYGRYGLVGQNESSVSGLETSLFVKVVISGPLSGEKVRIKIRRDIVGSSDISVVSKFTTKSISVENDEYVRVITKSFRIDSNSDGYIFGNKEGNLRGYNVSVEVVKNDEEPREVFGNEKRTFYSGMLSMLNPYIKEDGTTRDTDGDGLSDGEEGQERDIEYRSNPNNPDTDFDGLDDAREVRERLNPSSNDTDNDGLSDLWELVFENRSKDIDPRLPVDANTNFSGLNYDDDGLDNLEEAKAGTDPNSTSPQSVNEKRDASIYNVTYVTSREYVADALSETTTTQSESQSGSFFPLVSTITSVIVAISIAVLFYTKRKRKLSHV